VHIILRAPGAKRRDAPWKDGDHVDGYWLMNCWNRIDAIDAEHSIAEDVIPGRKDERIHLFKHLAFKAPLDADLFGFEAHLPGHRFVSARLRDAIEAGAFNKAHVFSRRTSRPDR
jgi:hypothetical protein